MPLQRRVPKFGFKNINRKDYRGINLDTIQNLINDKKVKKELNIEQIIEFRLAHKNDLIKILGRGKIEDPVKIFAHKFSTAAKASIEAAGGEAVIV
jgi:large subunit ribosomal protein L15